MTARLDFLKAKERMPDKIFYVGATDQNRKFTGYVPAKFLMRNGAYVMNPMPGGSQKSFIYSDAAGSNKTAGSNANPYNYLIVPETYTEQQARDFAAGIAHTLGGVSPEDKTGAAGQMRAIRQMTAAFFQGGSQDLQRHPQWGVPKGSIVPAFVGGGSNHLGYVTGLAGLPAEWSEIGGGTANWINGHVVQPVKSLFGPSTEIDSSGPHGLSPENYANIVQGYSDGLAARMPPSPFNDYGYSPRRSAGRIGEGNGGLLASVAGIDPQNPTQPAPPPQNGGSPEITSKGPVRFLSRASRNGLPPFVFDGGTPAVPLVPPSEIPSAGHAASFNDRFGQSPRPPIFDFPDPAGAFDVGLGRRSYGPPTPQAGAAGPQNSLGPSLPYLMEYIRYLNQLNAV